jgi:thymidylate synthase, flavin-dependent
MHTVRLIGMTQPMGTVVETGDAADLLAYCARVSSAANQDNHVTGPRLLRSLVKRKEWSPFEMVSLTFEIETTRDIARQILRHRSLTFQEFSQRYAEVKNDFVLRPARASHPTDRQRSVPMENQAVTDWWTAAQMEHRDHTLAQYKAALDMGIAKEVARAILPEGMTPTKLYAQGTLRSWIHYVQLRAAPGTQLEHRLIANKVWDILGQQFPSLANILAEQVEA